MPVPVLIGIADIKNRSEEVIEPLELMLSAIHAALLDTSLPVSEISDLQSSIDSISVVNTWTWRYSDLPTLISQRLGLEASVGGEKEKGREVYRELSHHGGDSPVRMVDEAARRIARGECRLGVVVGGEALGSLSQLKGKKPQGWTEEDKSARGVSVSDLEGVGDSKRHKIGLPIHIYPLYENAFRAHRNQSLYDNHAESAELYARFAKVAEKNPVAWNFGTPAKTKEEIGAVGKANRMICYPYPLLMNAFNNVNLAAACVLTSVEFARELGIDESRWIYPLGGAGTSDSERFWERPNFYESPSISRSLDAGLEAAGLRKDDVDMFDFYSCFPIVPKLACQHLGIPITKYEKPITLLGGLTSFGGAGNNYSMHALTAMVRELRKGKIRNGLVLANGGVATYQHVICLSNRPRSSPYPTENPLPGLLEDGSVPEIDEIAEGEAVIETYTVEFGRDGKPKRGFVVGRLKENGHRFVANEADEVSLKQLASDLREPIGRSGWVSNRDGRNVFRFDLEGKL
ncbi:Thiolase-like protein [Glarea lozoyensis ATCC 20868]|uniref:Thiolase-like protein n=1 Tax=Glarea lozoyensis (strain ATCC 20868 / MF5171) TaxID=1116229 RepID=S3DSJ1_GLAL2|nr:Thiolase-like protein [Glarea lozoyensis ATCC 20868]EPE34931.1 Thiolase-like protein [Glarea lozoyensis ATCC 20868]